MKDPKDKFRTKKIGTVWLIKLLSHGLDYNNSHLLRIESLREGMIFDLVTNYEEGLKIYNDITSVKKIEKYLPRMCASFR